MIKNSQNAGNGARIVKTARALPSNRLCKIVSNYTRRGISKLIPVERHTEKVEDYTSLDEFSDNNYIQYPSEEILLNSMRTSPPKAEISTVSEKTHANYEVTLLKRQLSAEKVKYATLEKAYKELVDLNALNEIAYKNEIFKLQNQETKQSRFALKSEFDLISQRLSVLENCFFRSKK